MAYGFATHLWLFGNPAAGQLRDWLTAAVPDVHAGDVEAWQLGDRVLLSAVNTSDRERRWRSIGVVNAVSPVVKGFDWVSVDMHPDHGSWRIEQSSGSVIEWDPESAEEGQEEPPPASVETARVMIKALVPLELAALHHYVDWTHRLEEAAEGAPAPALNVPCRRLALDLPPAPKPPVVARVATTAAPALARYWLAIACMLATAFTVSVVQAPGPAAFGARLTHFLIQATTLWLLGTGLSGITANGWPGVRVALGSAGAIVAAGVLWAVVPV